MTAVLPHITADTAASADTTPAVPASWPARAGAFAIDVLFGAGVVATMALVMSSTPQGSWLWWVCLVTLAVVVFAVLVNRWLLPTLIGSSVGRTLVGIAVVQAGGDAVGPWRLMVRDFAHVLDTLPVFVGWLWPLWDSRRRTFADLLARNEVHRVAAAQPARRRLTVALLAAAAGLAVAGAGLGYLTVYRHDLAVSQARQQIAVQGPKIVEDLLSYDAANVQADFERARSLVTDGYRPQVVAQQQAVQKAGIISNEYWVTNSAVLPPSTADHATMLLLLQGQRGEAPKQRFITATVQVNFERSRDGRWRVADLAVLAKPQPGGAGR